MWIIFNEVWFKIQSYFTLYKKRYFAFLTLSFIAFGIGVYLSIVDSDFWRIIGNNSQSLFDFISGEQNFLELFFNKLLLSLLVSLILFVCSLSFYSFFVNYVFIGYQSLLLGCCCVSLIALYGIRGIFCLLLVLPINLLFLFNLCNLCVILEDRVVKTHKYNIEFKHSFVYYKTFIKIAYCILIFVAICFVYAFIYGLFLKSFIFSLY